MRIVTRPDFDGLVCAVILLDALNITEPIKWVEPSEIQKGQAEIREGDVLANLPFDRRCSLWFDHHFSNRIDEPFDGAFAIAPSAAGIVYAHYRKNLPKDYADLVKAADKIDSADLTRDEVEHPEVYPYILLSMTIAGHHREDEPYWLRLIELFRSSEIHAIMQDPEVKVHCDTIIRENEVFREQLLNHTILKDHVSITDFRSLEKTPTGNRFLVYSLFPDAVVSVKIRYDDDDRDKIIVSVGHSIFNRNCRVNVGLMLSEFEGGGHRGAGACSFHASKADDYIPKIIQILVINESNEIETPGGD